MKINLTINGDIIPAEIRINQDAKRGPSPTLYLDGNALPSTAKKLHQLLNTIIANASVNASPDAINETPLTPVNDASERDDKRETTQTTQTTDSFITRLFTNEDVS